MSKFKINNSNKIKENKDTEYIIIFLIFTSVFALVFLVSYLLTGEYISRNSAVSLQEEAKQTFNNLSIQDLNNLYKNQVIDQDEVIVLGYHQIRDILDSDTHEERLFITPVKTFKEEMKYLYDNHYQTITLEEYLNYLRDKKNNLIPKKSVVLTFDDGYATQYLNAYPILKKYNFTATFFIYGDCIDKYPVCLTSREIEEMVSNGMKLANHTEHHIYLTKYKDRTIQKEIINNQKLLEKFGKGNVEKVIAYPYGIVDERVKKIVKDLGYIGGFGVSVYAKDNQDIYNLPRYLMGENIDNFYDLFKNRKD